MYRFTFSRDWQENSSVIFPNLLISIISNFASKTFFFDYLAGFSAVLLETLKNVKVPEIIEPALEILDRPPKNRTARDIGRK